MEGEKPKINGAADGSKAVLKKMIPQLLISVSLFSFLLSYSTSLSTFSSSLSSPKLHRFSFSFSFNKNCLFLICNGLLVFLSKTSGFIHPPSAPDLNDDLLQFKITDTFHTSYSYHDHEFHQNNNINAGVKNPPDQVSIFIAESDRDDELEEELINKDDQNQPICWLFQDDDEDEGDHLDLDEDEDDDDDEKEMRMSTDELNKKFEDFIRKMKEEIIINEASYSHNPDKLLLLN